MKKIDELISLCYYISNGPVKQKIIALANQIKEDEENMEFTWNSTDIPPKEGERIIVTCDTDIFSNRFKNETFYCTYKDRKYICAQIDLTKYAKYWMHMPIPYKEGDE